MVHVISQTAVLIQSGVPPGIRRLRQNMIKAGIIDPAKVTRGALENAASIAAMILTTEALITDIPEEEKPMPGAPDMGGMGGGMGF